MRKLEKEIDLFRRIVECIDSGNYLDTRHSAVRRFERGVSRTNIVFVLRNGIREKGRDRYDSQFRTWTYAIRGKDSSGRRLRIIIAFEDDFLLLVTAVTLD
jgi:hypothetical protein